MKKKIIIILCLIFFFSLFQKIMYTKDAKKTVQSYEQLENTMIIEIKKQEVKEQDKLEVVKEQKTFDYPHMEINHQGLLEENEDYCGWLYIPCVEVSYPITQGADNDYYLTHDFYKEDSVAGSIFLDSEADREWKDRNTFIFGHNMKNGSMFGNLKHIIQEKTVLEEKPYFYIYLENQVRAYYIFSYYIVEKDNNRFKTFTSDESYQEYVDWALENSLKSSTTSFEDMPDIVTLVTCHGAAGGYKRLIIHGYSLGITYE